MNMTHKENWYTGRHEEMGLLIGSFLAPALIKRNMMCAGGFAHL
jgi:hypothetical protein